MLFRKAIMYLSEWTGCPLYACILRNLLGPVGLIQGVSKVECKPLVTLDFVIGWLKLPSECGNPGCLAGRRGRQHEYRGRQQLHVRVGLSDRRSEHHCGLQGSWVRGRWAPVMIGEVALSPQGGGAAGWAGRPGGDSASFWAGVSHWVAVRPGQESCWQLVGAFCWAALRSDWLVELGEDARDEECWGSHIPKRAELNVPCVPAFFATY